MSDPKKSRKQLLDEIAVLRRRLEQLEDAEGKWKRTEEALRQSEQDKSLILGSLSELISYQDKSLKIVWANKAAGDSVGKSADELVGRYCYEIWHGRKEPCLNCPVAKSIETGQPQEAEVTSPDGRVWYIRGCPVLNEQGEVMGAVEVTLEITERRRTERTLRESEKRFRDVVENAFAWIWEVDAKGKYTYASPFVEKYLGYKADEILKKHFYDLFHPEDREELKRAAFEVFAKKQPFREFLNRNVGKNGKTIWLLTSGVPMLDEKGNLLGYRGADIDITKRKQAEEQLQIRDKAIESSISAIAIAEPGGNLIYVNSAFLKMWGYDGFKEVVGKPAVQFWQFEDLAEEVVEALHAKGKWTGELSARRKDGTEFNAQIMASTVKRETGEPDYVMASFIDITDRKKAALALKHRREFERLITDISRQFINLSSEQIDEGINQALRALGEFAQVDRSYVFQFSDDSLAMSNTHEWCAEGITSQIDNLQDISVDIVPWWTDKLKKFENIHIPDVEKLPASAKNEKKVLQAQAIQSLIVIPMVYNRQLVGFMGFDSVRTKRTWSEESIAMLTIVSEIFTNTLTRRRIQQELDLYHEKMFRAEQLASLGTVSATIAHELNQPLTVIQLFLQQGLRALKDDNDVDKVAEVIDDCLGEIVKAASTVDRFRRFARKAAPIYVTEVDLVEVAERVVGLLTEGARRKKLDLSVNVESRPPHIIGNSVELEQMFFVLIQNAIQAADEQRQRDMTMTITISTQAGQMQLTFADTCGGIEHKNIDKIFEPFFTTKPPNIGTGLGLCILERIVKRHGGSVRAESQEGDGTIFYIGLPIKN